MSLRRQEEIRFSTVHDFVDNLFGEDMHAKRVESLACATLGALHSCSLAVRLIGQGLAQAHELNQKHCIKQVDRLFSNPKLDVHALFPQWISYVRGERMDMVVAMDWTEFDADGHSTLMLSLVTGHGRATPLLWQSVPRKRLKNHRNDHEDALLGRLKEALPEDCRVTILADRGFCDSKLYSHLKDKLGFDFIIRFRDNILVEDKQGKIQTALKWVEPDGRLRTLREVKVTGERVGVARAVFVRRKAMKEAWCLVSSREDLSGQEIVEWYGRRWGIESQFRDTKNYRFGMGMGAFHTKSCERRDRLFLVSALAIALLTLLGMAGEAVGLERTIKANTEKRRTYSLFTQGTIYYGLLPGMKEREAEAMIGKFHELLSKQRVFREILGIL
jgi:hypothetical protein